MNAYSFRIWSTYWQFSQTAQMMRSQNNKKKMCLFSLLVIAERTPILEICTDATISSILLKLRIKIDNGNTPIFVSIQNESYGY